MAFWEGAKNFLFGDRYRFDPSKFQGIEGGGEIREGLKQFEAEAAGRSAPTAATSREDQFRALQMGLGQQLAGIAGGQTPGPGELAVQRAGQQALRAQTAQGAGARGIGAQALRSQLAGQGALMRTNLAGQAGLAGAQDVAAAQQALAGLTSQGRAADQATSLANLQSQLATQSQSDATRLGIMRQLVGMGLSEQQARLAAEQMAFQTQRQGFIPAALGAGGMILGAALGGPLGAQTGGQAGAALGRAF
jgi:hypothetical protein